MKFYCSIIKMNEKIRLVIEMIVVLVFINGCGMNSVVEKVEQNLGVELEHAKVLSSEEEHEGFHYDGYTYAVVEIDGKQQKELEDSIETSSHWKQLPLTDFLEELVYGGEEMSSFVADKDGKALFPTVHQGYYYIYDEESDSYRLEEAVFNEQSSHNFVIAIYDSESMQLYYYKFDS